MRRLLTLLMCFAMLVSGAIAQSKKIAGKIIDEKGNPVPNASVILKGTKIGTSTLADGTFELSVPSSAKVLVISSIGFTSKDVSIVNKSEVSITLQSTSQGLDEVVVTGYGTQRKTNVTSAQSKVSGEAVANKPLTSVDQALQGKVAGLVSVTGSGQPGANTQIRIRGIGSMTASAQPLFVVDGVQINSGDLTNQTTTSNALAGINMDDIDNVEVLKDAAATSIYGSRGGNGVILITTKKGKTGKAQFSLNGEIGTNKVASIPAVGKPIRANDWITLMKESLINAGYSQATADAQGHLYGDTSHIDTDWFGLLTRAGSQQQYNLSASGGTEKLSFYLSGGYFSAQANTINSWYKKYSGLTNIKWAATEKLNINVGISGSYQNFNDPSVGGAFANPMLAMYFLRPTQNPYNADGTLNISRTGNLNFPGVHNPIFVAQNNIYNARISQLKPNLSLDYTIIKGLKYTNKIGVDYNNIEEFQYWNPKHGDGLNYNGYGFAEYDRYFLYDWVNQLDYHLNILKNGDLYTDLKAGYEAISSNAYFLRATADNYSTDKLVDLANASAPVVASTSKSDYSFASAFTSAVINYKNRYILSGSFRRDGSSRFGPNNKYGNFYSIGGAWNISKESFLANVKPISNAKLRVSYGTSGNAEIGNYTASAQQNSGYNYNLQPGTAFETVGNETLTWEKSKQFDAGFDVGLYKDRLNIVFDYYKKTGSGLLYSTPLSGTTGFTSKTGNIGAMTNEGVELTINATPVEIKDFKWDVSFNITHNTNKVTSIPDPTGTGIVDLLSKKGIISELIMQEHMQG